MSDQNEFEGKSYLVVCTTKNVLTFLGVDRLTAAADFDGVIDLTHLISQSTTQLLN